MHIRQDLAFGLRKHTAIELITRERRGSLVPDCLCRQWFLLSSVALLRLWGLCSVAFDRMVALLMHSRRHPQVICASLYFVRP